MVPTLPSFSKYTLRQKKIFVEVNYAVGRKKRFSEVHNTHKISEEVRSSTWGALLTGAVTFFSHNIEKKREIIIIYFLERA